MADGTRRGGRSGAQKQMHGLWVRFETRFLLDDIRIARLSDRAGFLYIRLEALALELRCEVLPVEFDARELACRFRREVGEIEAGLEELAIAGSLGALVERLEDGRIRLCGIKSKHGTQIRWRDDQATTDAQLGCNRAASGPHVYTDQEPEPDTEPPPTPPQGTDACGRSTDGETAEQATTADEAGTATAEAITEAAATATDSRRSEGGGVAVDAGDPERMVFDAVVASWNGTTNGKAKTTRQLAYVRLAHCPYEVIGHAMSIASAVGKGTVRLPWAVLSGRLMRAEGPADCWSDRARVRVQEIVEGCAPRAPCGAPTRAFA
jgi:hypothetical protein